jgi:AraC family transcriptional regulator, transcriptional activator of pobA
MSDPISGRAAASFQPAIPVVDFYADSHRWPTSQLVHSEPLAERSQLHDWSIRPHRHSRLTQLFLLLEGSGVALLDSVRFDAAPVAVLVVPEYCVHEFEWARDSSGYVLSIASSLVNELGRELGPQASVLERPGVIGGGTGGQYLRTLFERIHEEYRQRLSFKEASLDCLIRLLALWLARAEKAAASPAPHPTRASRHLARFRQLVEEHHKSQWAIADYAAAIGITPSHLNAICRQLTGRSALETVHERVMLAARRELAYTETTIAGVAQRLGFSDASYFTRFFRRHAGLAPSRFRRDSGTHSAGSLTE